jgi:Tfp pilus assembly protein PilX
MSKRRNGSFSVNDRGIALVMALIITLLVFLLVASTMYVVTQSMKMSGTQKYYKTACEASDGAVEIMKDAINAFSSASVVNVPSLLSSSSCLQGAVIAGGPPCKITFNLPSSMSATFDASVTVTRLYATAMPGGTLEFASSRSFGGKTAIYYRIQTNVFGPKVSDGFGGFTQQPNSSACENSVVFRQTV